MTAVIGHIMDVEFPGEFKSWHGTNTESLFDAPIIHTLKRDCAEIGDNLAKEILDADVLFIWTDCDREGENIGMEVRNLCVDALRNNQGGGGRGRRGGGAPRRPEDLIVKRARFSALQTVQVKRAWDNPILLDERQAAGKMSVL